RRTIASTSTIGLAASPGTAVLPTCSTPTARSPSAPATRSRTRRNVPSHAGSYGTTTTGSARSSGEIASCGAPFIAASPQVEERSEVRALVHDGLDRAARARQQRRDAGAVPGEERPAVRDAGDRHGAAAIDSPERVVGVDDRDEVTQTQPVEPELADRRLVEALDVVIAAHDRRAAEPRAHHARRHDSRHRHAKARAIP